MNACEGAVVRLGNGSLRMGGPNFATVFVEFLATRPTPFHIYCSPGNAFGPIAFPSKTPSFHSFIYSLAKG